MICLGLHCGSLTRNALVSHRMQQPPAGAAVIVHNGAVLAAAMEDRWRGLDEFTDFPVKAIELCLAQAGIALADVDVIAVGSAEADIDATALQRALEDATARTMTGREWLAGLFLESFALDVSAKLLRFCPADHAQIRAAWLASGYPDALCVHLEGLESATAGAVVYCDSSGVRELHKFTAAQSPRRISRCINGLLGFGPGEDSAVYGLAPYGNSEVYATVLERMFELLPDGGFSIVSDTEMLELVQTSGLAQIARRLDGPITQAHQDVAAATQLMLDRVMGHVLTHFKGLTGARRLCISGSIAGNPALVGRIVQAGLFEQTSCMPMANSGAAALGAALAVAIPPQTGCVMTPLYVGQDIDVRESVAQHLQRWGSLIETRNVTDAASVAAQLVAAGKVIGWVQGRTEFGSRSLGHRSVLADPRNAHIAPRLAAMLLQSSCERCCTGAVLQERLAEVVGKLGGADALAYQPLTLPVRPEVRAALAGIVFPNHTATLHSVAAEHDPYFYALITAFARLTGVPVVLNTSMEDGAVAMVETIDAAVAYLLRNGIDHLIVGDWLVGAAGPVAAHPGFLDLTPVVPRICGLVRHSGTHLSIERNNPAASASSMRLAPQVFSALLEGPAGGPLRNRLRSQQAEHAANLQQLFTLWRHGFVDLQPAGHAGHSFRPQ